MPFIIFLTRKYLKILKFNHIKFNHIERERKRKREWESEIEGERVRGRERDPDREREREIERERVRADFRNFTNYHYNYHSPLRTKHPYPIQKKFS